MKSVFSMDSLHRTTFLKDLDSFTVQSIVETRRKMLFNNIELVTRSIHRLAQKIFAIEEPGANLVMKMIAQQIKILLQNHP